MPGRRFEGGIGLLRRRDWVICGAGDCFISAALELFGGGSRWG